MRTDLIHDFRAKLKAGAAIGPFCKTGDPAVIEALGHAGMDFVILDLEHGPQDNHALSGLIRAAELSQTVSVVRVGGLDGIARALDQGALAVQVPHIATAADARAMQALGLSYLCYSVDLGLITQATQRVVQGIRQEPVKQ